MHFDIHPTTIIPGIYAIRAGGYVYVGESKDIRKRFAIHCSAASRGKHARPELNGLELRCEILAVEPDAICRGVLERKWIERLEGITNLAHLGKRRGTLSQEQIAAVRALKPRYGEGIMERAAAQLDVSLHTIYEIRNR